MVGHKPSTFKAAIEEDDKFRNAIGGLVLAFADMESALYSVLRFYSKTSEPIARAIFSGCRAGTMLSYMRAIAHNTDLDKDRLSDLEEVFSQISAINTMRDMLIHHSGSTQEFDDDDPSKRVLTDSTRVSRYGNAKLYMIGSAEVENMTADLVTCCWRLVAHADKLNKPFKPGLDPEGKLNAWLYKSPQPDRTNRNWYSYDQKHRRRRSPSPKKP